MGANASAQRDAKSPEDTSAMEERAADLSESRCGHDDDDTVDAKQLQKNGQISVSSLNGKTDEQTDFNGPDEDNTLAEVGQTEAMPQKEDSPESVEVLQDEVSPQANGEQDEKCVSADETTPTEEKVAEEKPTESNEVGFKKIFRFVGFKFTLKKDKNEKTEPVQLLTVKETEDGASEAAVEETKVEPVTAEIKPEDEKKPDAPEKEKEASAEDAAKTEAELDLPASDAPAETKADGTEETDKTPADEPAEEVETSTDKEKEPEPQAESPTSPPSQETQSPFRRFFSQGIFSNLRKKTSFKKSKEEEPIMEKSAEEDIKETEEKEEVATGGEEQVKEDAEEVETEEQVDKSEVPEKSEAATEKSKAREEETPSAPQEQKEEELKVDVETTSEAAPLQEPEAVERTTTCEVSETSAAVEKEEIKPTGDTKLTDGKATDSSEEQQTSEKSSAEATTEAEVQDKTKAQGSPLKKLFTGAGLKKLSSKKQKGKKETESKQTESTEQAAEQVQSSTESGEAQKPDSSASSPEESGEHVVGEESQAEANVEVEGEAATSDSEKKKDGILHWASFKKLVTPKKRVKRSSESEDETPGDKPKSATLSSTESAVFEEKAEENKSSGEEKEEAKEESQVDCKTETKAEKTEQTTEEPKKKIDTSVSWEALICVGSAKKRARKTSDSDDEETKIEEEVQKSGEEQTKTAESPIESSQEVEREHLASSPEQEGELVSTWESFKRLVTQRKKPKAEDKSDEAQGPEQAASDSELPKEESSFSLRKLIPRRKKKSDVKQGQVSSDVGSAEEDSDTPAVVPLSEYDNEQSEKATDEQKQSEEAKPEVTPVTPVTPGKASAEDRSPSWISATVENAEDEAEGKPLSDIPEEGDTAATPKSTDNTIAEDIIEFTSEAVTAIEPAEETEMVSALSRITELPDTSGETSPVPEDGVVKKAEAILQEAVETISITSSAVAVTVAEEQAKSMVVSTSPFQIESAIKEEKVVLAVHEKSEAITICTGLDTSEIKAVEEESNLKAIVEAVTAVSEALSVEVAAEDQTLKPEEAEVAGDKVSVAQVNEVQTECKEQHPASVEHTMEETVVVHTMSEIQEATAVKVAEVTPIQEIEIVEEVVVAENSPKVLAESPVESTVEHPVCAQTVEITEATAVEEEAKELKDVSESIASVEIESVEVEVTVPEEITSLADSLLAEITVSQEDPIPVLATVEEIAVKEEIVCVCPPSDSKTEAEGKSEVATENIFTQVHITTDVEVVSVSDSVDGNSEIAASNISIVIEEAGKTDEEEVEAKQKEAEAIQEQSTVIVQEVLQNVVENLSEMHMEQELEEKPVEEIHSEKPEKISSAAEEERLAQDAPVSEEKIMVDTQIQEEIKPKTEDEAEEKPTEIITETLPVSEAVQISEKVVEAVAEEIKPQEHEMSSVSVEATQLPTDVVKQEVEIKKGEKEAEEDKTVSIESEDGKCQVKEDQNEEASGTTETPASEESSQVQTASLESTKHAEIVEEESQQAQDMKIDTTMASKDESATQDSEISLKEDSTKSQEPSKDVPQTDLEEAQKDISAPEMKGQEGSGDPDCQKRDAEASEVKTAAVESPKATKEEDTEKEIGTVTTETATES